MQTAEAIRRGLLRVCAKHNLLISRAMEQELVTAVVDALERETQPALVEGERLRLGRARTALQQAEAADDLDTALGALLDARLELLLVLENAKGRRDARAGQH